MRALLSCFQFLNSVSLKTASDRHTCSTVAGAVGQERSYTFHICAGVGGMGITRWPRRCESPRRCTSANSEGGEDGERRRVGEQTVPSSHDRRPTSRSRRLVRCTRPVGRTNSSKRTSSPGIKGEVRDEVERAQERGTGRGRRRGQARLGNEAMVAVRARSSPELDAP